MNVYSPCTFVLKHALWKNLLDLKSSSKDGEWIFGGYFNTMKNRGKKIGVSVSYHNSEWRDFPEFIDQRNLIDIPCRGKKYSWFSGDGVDKSMIDLFSCGGFYY